jgi:hypothetical protein
MKRFLLLLAAVCIALPAYAQSTFYTSSSGIGIGTSSPTTGTALDMGSNTNSFLLPIGTTGQRPTGVAGMLRYNSTNSIPEFYISSWLPVPLTASSPIVISSTTGNITCPTCNTSSANVNSVSGDGALISNSASTGAVTLTLGNAAAYSIWGNNTSSSATPSYTTSPELSGTITDIQSIGATSTDGVVLTNTTAATSGNQQWSPRVRWTGKGWKTNATAASQEVDAIAEVQPVQGTANPTFNWVLSGQINNGGYGALLTVPSGGGLNLNSGVYQIDGTQIAASNLLNGVTGSGNIVLAISPSLTTPNIGAATGTSLIVPLIYPPSDSTTALQIDKANGTSNVVNVDTTNGRVGIGTTAPGNPLSVNGIIESQTGGFKFPDGTTQTTASTSGTAIHSVHTQTFTSSGTYTPTAGMAYAIVEVVGGGGGGSSSAHGDIGGSGGGSGAYAKSTLTAATIGSSQTITVGSGGAGGAAGSGSTGNAGSNGNSSSLGSLVTAGGGDGATATGSSGGQHPPSDPGDGGAAGTGDYAVAGNPGMPGFGMAGWGGGDEGPGGNGGKSQLGAGGAGGSYTGSAGSAGSYGGGGGGSGPANGGYYAGGAGGAGVVSITEYCTQ